MNVKQIKNVATLTINTAATNYVIDNSSGITVKYPILNSSGVSLSEAT